MANIFNSIRVRRPKRNAFDLSYENKLTCKMGQLIPIMNIPVIPGDKIRVNTEALIRFAPMLAPVMHRVNAFVYYFFVPYRLLWPTINAASPQGVGNGWENFITKGIDGDSVPDFPCVTYHETATGEAVETYTPVEGYWSPSKVDYSGSDISKLYGTGSLWDYIGLPSVNPKWNATYSEGLVELPTGFKVSAFPFMAYQMIYNEYFRDQNLQEPINLHNLSSTPQFDDITSLVDILTLRTKAWEKDYFTSALPWTQRGPEVTVPISGQSEVVVDPDAINKYPVFTQQGDPNTSYPVGRLGQVVTGVYTLDDSGATTANHLVYNPKGTLVVDNESSGGISINDLRTSNALQRWLEKNARGGSRYIEQIFAHFGVRSSDSRLQRPQYLGGGRIPISFSEVLQTSATETDSPQANMAGHGIAASGAPKFKAFFEEHGVVLGILSIIPRTAYQQGINREWTKFDNMDYYFPEFAHLSEQPIYNQEIYADQDAERNAGIFGYTPRYAEYKTHLDETHGAFRESLSYWHLGRIFRQSNPPVLNGDFVQAQPSSRIFAVEEQNVENIYIQLYNHVSALRLMPKYGTPNL